MYFVNKFQQLLKDLGHIRSKVAVVHKKEKEIYQRMFQQGQQTPEQKDNEEEVCQILFPVVVRLSSLCLKSFPS